MLSTVNASMAPRVGGPDLKPRERSASHVGFSAAWKSEFLQMGAYVLLIVFLFQKGSAEFKSLMRAAAVNLT